LINIGVGLERQNTKNKVGKIERSARGGVKNFFIRNGFR